jgi:hypothetical protein
MRRLLPASAVGLLLLVMAGCGTEENGFQRDPVTNVTGTVLVDGKPQKMVAVRLERIGGPDATATTSKMLTPGGFTDEQGKFSIGTYEGGPESDGAPDGEYQLTFQWGQISLMGGGRYEGDKFKGRYADPKKSQWKVTVAGQAVDVGTINLSTSGSSSS